MQLEPVNPGQFSGLTFPLKEHESSLLSSEQWRNTSNRVDIPASLFRNPGAPSMSRNIAHILDFKSFKIQPFFVVIVSVFVTVLNARLQKPKVRL
jgi:hypothetical protein